MLQIRKSSDRGLGDHGWLLTRHTFSFADYYDENHMSFRSLRVINEDRIQGGRGFGTHPHRDMEIITYVISGALEHKDSMGNTTRILPGEVQRMSAGTGVTHSEFNPLPDRETHLLQIWIMPKQRGGRPGYGQKSFADQLASKKLILAVSNDGREGSIAIQQDADLYLSRLKAGDHLDVPIRPDRYVWAQIVKGRLEINGESLEAGDGLAASQERALSIRALEDCEILLFDLA